MGPSPGWSQCCALGFMQGRSDAPALRGLVAGSVYIHGGELVQGGGALGLCGQRRGAGYKHAGSNRWASHRLWDNSSRGTVPRLLLVLLWDVVVCGEALAQPPCPVPQQQRAAETASARSTRKGRGARLLQRPCGATPAVGKGVSHRAAPRCALRPSGRWRCRSGLVRLGAGGAGLGVEHLNGSRLRVCPWEWAQAAPQQDCWSSWGLSQPGADGMYKR